MIVKGNLQVKKIFIRLDRDYKMNNSLIREHNFKDYLIIT